jgi:hypothetical protein
VQEHQVRIQKNPKEEPNFARGRVQAQGNRKETLKRKKVRRGAIACSG